MKKLKLMGIFGKIAIKILKFYGKNVREKPIKFYIRSIGTLFGFFFLFLQSYSLPTLIILYSTIILFCLSIVVEAIGARLGVWELFKEIGTKQAELILKLKKEKDKISYYETNTSSFKKPVEISLPSDEPITKCLLENSNFRIKLEKREKT